MQEFEYLQKAMGTDVSLSIITDIPESALTAKHDTFTVIDAYEQRFSRFLEHSELQHLNTRGKLAVSDSFIEVLTEAIRLSKKTEGVFNPLLQIAKLGYAHDFEHIPHTQTISKKTYNTDISTVHIDPQSNTVTLQEGQQLDFGGFLKGYLAEKIADDLQQSYPHFQGIIVNLGGDIHTKGTDAHGNPFVFAIENPITQQDIFIPIQNQSLSTSGTYKRTWHTDTGTMHHILAPDGIQNPQTTIISASIIHNIGPISEAYTKVFLNTDISQIKRVAVNLPCSYILITDTGVIVKNTNTL